MVRSGQNEKINYQRIAPIIAISFAIGFGAATGAYFFIFCENCFVFALVNSANLSPEEKCKDDSRCILEPAIPPDPEISEKGEYKIALIEQIVDNPIIQQALIESNEDLGKMSDSVRDDIIAQREKTWTTAPESTPFMRTIIENDVSDFLRSNLVFQSEEFGDIAFGEHILTNSYGPNVAVTLRVDNYDQSNDDWWSESEKIGRPLVRQCEFDASAKMYSEDIVIKILDSNGEFIGIMNSATPCDVTQKASETKTKIEPVPQSNITPVGKQKILLLKELMKNPAIQDALKTSNEEFAARGDLDMIQLRNEIEWPPLRSEPTDLQLSILHNNVSEILRNNLVTQSEKFGQISFGEFILTNSYGVNIASTIRTFDYVQSTQEWWKVAVDNDILVRECGWDESVKMTSEDIVIAVYDEKGNLAGVLNSATTCDVILNKSPSFYGDSN